ncbi:MAG: tyrosine-type recombinase/integrase [Candidatus Omnitrophica bacterium]|nr:tyrosine-type recombinase/integrase [Candidatus Omnitrophota bacterium]
MLPLLNEFKEKTLTEGRCLGTARAKIKNCGYFERWYGSDTIKKVSRNDIENYKTYLIEEHRTQRGKKLQGVTIVDRLSALSDYFKFLLTKKVIFFDPTLGVIIPKKKRLFQVGYLTEKEMEELINKPDTYTYVGIRDRLIFELLYTSSLRNNELCRLKLSEVDMKEKYIYPSRSKGGRECAIPILPSTYQVLHKYLEISRPRLVKIGKKPKPNIEELLISERGTAFTTSGIGKLFSKYRNGDEHYHAHALRRACAVHMLKNGASVRDVQVVLGHNSLESTQMYTQVTANDMKDILGKHHPREQYFKKHGKAKC